MSRPRERNVVLLGAPGSGKGTQAERIVARYGLPHISTGDMLRAAIAKGTEMGREARRFMDAGALVPDEVVVGCVRERLAREDTGRGFLLDGFPRTLPQAEKLDEVLAETARAITHAVLIDVPEDELVRRISGRRTCPGCGKIYHMVYDPPLSEGVCDVCGTALEQRADDNEETARKRLVVFRCDTEPVIEYYRAKGILGEAQGGRELPGEVFVQIVSILGCA